MEIEHCTYISGGLCSSCEGNYQPSEDRKSCVMKPSEQIIEHCTSTRINYPDTLQCYKCENGYALNQDENGCIQISDEKCERVDENNNNKCDKCLGECKIDSIDYCEDYDEEGNCEKCFKYFYLDEEKHC